MRAAPLLLEVLMQITLILKKQRKSLDTTSLADLALPMTKVFKSSYTQTLVPRASLWTDDILWIES